MTMSKFGAEGRLVQRAARAAQARADLTLLGSSRALLERLTQAQLELASLDTEIAAGDYAAARLALRRALAALDQAGTAIINLEAWS